MVGFIREEFEDKGHIDCTAVYFSFIKSLVFFCMMPSTFSLILYKQKGHAVIYLNHLLTDMGEVYHLLSNMVKDTGSETYFLSILQHLLLIRNDYYIRPQYYKVIEECVSQVVLHRSGMDPDFGYRERLDVDFTHLIDQCVDKAKVDESDLKAAEFSKKFDEEFSARQDAQAESQKKEEKIKELEGQICNLKTQVMTTEEGGGHAHHNPKLQSEATCSP
ncbi:unnamed protein product [Oncorhynchus mykiss]|uniref:Formin FH3 domain-containing protein n=1 Tax=Oncorhynchus mykiss TaxID=8022 RepID=A0A060XYJ9_ONCMY|nr:unnamed protein product [Oncorhynchus mykiss]